MKKIMPQDVIDIYEYERRRDKYVRAYQQAKRGRVFNLGPAIVVHFHTFDTVFFQLHEFLRSQRVRDASEVEAHLHIYNSLLPEAGHLLATLQVDFPRKETIQQLLGLPQQLADGHLHIRAGDEAVTGTPQSNEKSPVAFVDFSFPESCIQKLEDTTSDLSLHATLAEYEYSLSLNSNARQAMLTDLS